jgi:hypothetical protein
MTATNSYGDPKEKMMSYPFLGAYCSLKCDEAGVTELVVTENALLAEPYKTTVFTVNNTVPGCSYKWNVAGA